MPVKTISSLSRLSTEAVMRLFSILQNHTLACRGKTTGFTARDAASLFLTCPLRSQNIPLWNPVSKYFFFLTRKHSYILEAISVPCHNLPDALRYCPRAQLPQLPALALPAPGRFFPWIVPVLCLSVQRSDPNNVAGRKERFVEIFTNFFP